MKPIRVPPHLVRTNGFDRRILSAYRAAVRRFAQRKFVSGVTISIKERAGVLEESAGPVIAIHVRKKRRRSRVPARDRVPPFILGVPTDVLEADYRLAAGPVGIPTAVAFPLRPGSSIGRQLGGTAASMGGIVENSSGDRYLLSAAHVLQEGGNSATGDAVLHPGPLDGLPAPGQPVTVARVARIHLGADAGVAILDPQTVAANNTTPAGRRILPPLPGFPVIGAELEKHGRTTGATRGIVQGVGTIAGLYPAFQLRPRPGDSLPYANGDSGALWYDAATCAAVGLHVGIDLATGGQYAAASLVSYVLDWFEMTWV